MSKEHQMDEIETTPQKRATGIPGLDHVSRGVLPSGQATLVLGQAATGKTVLGLQMLAHATQRGDGGVS